MNNLDLSIIILSYNTKDITLRALDKLKLAMDYCQKKLGNRIEVMVLDNASDDGSAQAIKAEFPWVKVSTSYINLGFSKGNNKMMKKAKTPYTLLLNSDVYVDEDSLYKAYAYFRVNLNCDVLGARLNYADGRLQASAGNLPNPLNLITWIFSFTFLPLSNIIIPPFHPKGKRFFSKAHQVGWVMGAFLMLKKEVFKKTGGFDENLFMHMEEVEWCKRIKEAGFKIWYVPPVEAVHLHGASTSFDLSSSFLNELKGIKYYLNEYYKSFYFPLKLILILGLIGRIMAFSLLGKGARARVYREGLSVI